MRFMKGRVNCTSLRKSVTYAHRTADYARVHIISSSPGVHRQYSNSHLYLLRNLRLTQMERARAILQKTSGGFDKICIVQDYVGFSLRNSPSMKTSMRTLNILQNHYPETLGVAYFLSPPFMFRGFWKVCNRLDRLKVCRKQEMFRLVI